MRYTYNIGISTIYVCVGKLEGMNLANGVGEKCTNFSLPIFINTVKQMKPCKMFTKIFSVNLHHNDWPKFFCVAILVGRNYLGISREETIQVRT